MDVNPNNVLATEIIPKEDNGDTTFTIKTKGELLPTIDSDADLNGWYELDDLTTVYEPGQSNVVITGDMTLYPSIEGGHWLIFNDNDPVWDADKSQYVSGGASFTPPAFYLDENTLEPDPPTWTGYQFGGWYTTPDCNDGDEFSFGSELTTNTTVYAKWIPSASQYRVIYWKQRPTDDYDAADADKTYDYAGSRLVNSNIVTGQIVNLEESDTKVYGANGTSGEADQEYFTYNANKTDQSVVVKADGSSVINVYYDRQVITINFYGDLYYYEKTDSSTGTIYGIINGEMVELSPDGTGGYTYNQTVINYTEYSGTRYIQTTDTTNNPEKYFIYNGSMTRIYRYNNRWYRTYNGGNSYSNRVNNPGTIYIAATDTNGAQYTDTGRELIYDNGTWKYENGTTIQTTPYTGQVYRQVYVDVANDNTLAYTLKGLYGGSIGYGEWPVSSSRNNYGTVTEYWWKYNNNSNGTTQLNAPWNSYTIASTASADQIRDRTWNLTKGNTPSTGQNLYYIGEDINGQYTIMLAETARSTSSTLNIGRGKFYGYTTYGWRIGSGNIGTGTGWHALNGNDGRIDGNTNTSGDIYIYYSRDKFSLTFYTNNGSNQVDVIQNVPYEKPLTEYATHSEGQKNGYFFLGWYADPSCTEPFDFGQTMPHTTTAVYGKWKMIRTRVVIEPGADNVYMGSQAKTFRLDYDERIDGGMLETATRAGYILDGWYTDPEFTNRFLFSNPVNSQTTGVDTTYGTANNWAAARAAYGDDNEDHNNVRNIIHLYAKWILDPDTSGYNIVYDAGDAALRDDLGNLLTTVPVDTRMYAFGDETKPSAKEAPSNYNDLYSFAYWEATTEDGTTIQLYPGNPIPLSELQASETIYDEVTGDVFRKTITLRAVYTTEAGDRLTHIIYDGDTFIQDLYPNGSREVQGKTKDGTERVAIKLDKEVNQTITLPNEDDFYLDGYELVGWSFFEGTYDAQIAAENAYNEEHPDNTVIHFDPGAQVAADNLEKNEVNDEENTLYAMWKPKTYTVTVRQIIESGVPDSTFTYVYKRGVENELDSVEAQQQALSGNTSVELGNFEYYYYDISGHVIHITTPVPTNDSYDVRVNAIVTRDDGTMETLNPTALGNYPILGDVVITYTYSPKVEVKLQKRDTTNHNTVLTGAQFTFTPVEFNTSTNRWENAGTGINMTVSNATLTQFLQEGTYRITETDAPEGYAKISDELFLTISHDSTFRLFTSSGGAVDAEVAELDSSTGKILTVYDNPIRTVTLSKTVEDPTGISESKSFTFTATVYESYESADTNTRLRNYTVGEGLITNSIGQVTINLAHGGNVALNIPNGCLLTVSETPDSSYETSYQWNSGSSVASNTFGETPEVITEDSTLTFTNKRITQDLKIRKITDDEEETGLAGAKFDLKAAGTIGGFTNKTDLMSMPGTDDPTILGYLSSGNQNDPTVFTLPAGKYTLTETAPPDNYDGLSDSVTLEVSAGGITISTEIAGEMNPVELNKVNNIFRLTVRNTHKVATVTVVKNVVGTEADKDAKYSFTATGLTEETFQLYGQEKKEIVDEVETVVQANSKVFEKVPYGSTITISETDNTDFDTAIVISQEGKEPSTIPDKDTGSISVDGDITITYTNTRNKQSVIVYKTDIADTPKPLPGAVFKLNDNTLTSSDGSAQGGPAKGYTAAVDLPVSETQYDLTETTPPDGYNALTSAVKITVSSADVTYIQSDYDGGNPQTAEQDDDGNYIIQVRDNPGVQLPMTGGPGAGLFGLVGGIVAALPFTVLVLRKKRPE